MSCFPCLKGKNERENDVFARSMDARIDQDVIFFSYDTTNYPLSIDHSGREPVAAAKMTGHNGHPTVIIVQAQWPLFLFLAYIF